MVYVVLVGVAAAGGKWCFLEFVAASVADLTVSGHPKRKMQKRGSGPIRQLHCLAFPVCFLGQPRHSKGRLQSQSLGRLFLPGGASQRLASRHRMPQRFQVPFGFRLMDTFDSGAAPHGLTTTCPAGPSKSNRCWLSTSRPRRRSRPVGRRLIPSRAVELTIFRQGNRNASQSVLPQRRRNCEVGYGVFWTCEHFGGKGGDTTPWHVRAGFFAI